MACRTRSTTAYETTWRPTSARLRWALVVLCLFAQPPLTFGQSGVVVDPHTLQFTPSTDHLSLLRYELEVFQSSGVGAPITAVNLGTPAPGSDGQIHIDLSPWHLNTALPAGTYLARVTATSQGGVGQSGFSNPFTFNVTCTYGLGSTSGAFPATGGSGSVTISAGTGCDWTGTSSVSWISVTGGTGTGNGSLTLTVAPNTTPTARTGTVTMGSPGTELEFAL